MNPEPPAVPVYLFARVWYGFKHPSQSDCPFDAFNLLRQNEIRERLESHVKAQIAAGDIRARTRLLYLDTTPVPKISRDYLQEVSRDVLSLLPDPPWWADIECRLTKFGKLMAAAGWILEVDKVVLHPAEKAPPLGPTEPLWLGRVPSEDMIDAVIDTLRGLENIDAYPPVVFGCFRGSALDRPTAYRAEVEIQERRSGSATCKSGAATHVRVDAWLTRLSRHVDGATQFLMRDQGLITPPSEWIAPVLPVEASADPGSKSVIRQLHAELGGATSESVEAPPALADSCTFRNQWTKSGSVWDIWFQGKQMHLHDLRGMAMIHMLLQKQGHTVETTTLAGTGELISEARSPTTGEIAKPQELIDSKAFAQFRARLAEIDQGIDECAANHDSARDEFLQTEKARILEELAMVRGADGRSRSFGTPSERGRTKVGKAIQVVLKQVAEHDPELAEHLRRSIKRPSGSAPSYQPDTPVTWILGTPG